MPIITTKSWNVRSLAFLGWVEVPEANMTTCQASLLVPLLVSQLAKCQEIPVSQLAGHIDPFHLVSTDNQRPETLSLPHG
jgi:hypothetical protein